MQIRAVILTLLLVFAGFVLEHLPMPDLLSWLQPLWLLLLISILVLHAPHQFGLWLAIPLGLMLDVENHQLLGAERADAGGAYCPVTAVVPAPNYVSFSAADRRDDDAGGGASGSAVLGCGAGE